MSAAEVDGAERQSVTPFLIIVIALAPAVVVSTFEATMMYTALPQLLTTFHTNAADAGWVLTAYTLVAAASAAVCGRLGDLYGRRRILLILLLLSIVGSVVSLCSQNLAGVIAGRAVQGLSGGLLPLCFGIGREHAPRNRVPIVIAVIAGTSMLAGAAGSLVSGRIIDAASWHWIFVASAALAVLATGCALLLPASPAYGGDRIRIDWIGTILFAPAVALVLYGVTQSVSWGWSDSRVIGLIAGGLVLLAGWAAWELRTEQPIINLRLFASQKQVLTLAATAVASIGPVGATGFLFSLVMQSPKSAPIGLGLSATEAGVLGFCTALLGFSLSPVSGRIARRVGARVSLVIGSVLGLITVVLLYLIGNHLPGFVLTALFLSVTTSFMLSSLPNLVVESVGGINTSEATGMYIVVQQAFNGVGNSVATLLLSRNLVTGTPFSTKGGYHQVYLLVALCTLVTLLIALVIRTRQPALTAEPSGVLVAEA